MSTTDAKRVNGAELNTFQPVNGERGSLQTAQVAFWTSSQGFDLTSGTISQVIFWESSFVYEPLLLDEESSIGETICVPDPITQSSCAA